MIIKTKPFGPIDTNSYLIINENSKEAFLIDAPIGSYNWAKKLLDEYSCQIKAVLYTHGHWDHTLDGHLFKEDNVPALGHSDDKLIFENPELMSNFLSSEVSLCGFELDKTIDDSDVIKFAQIEIIVRHVPGHCPGSLLFYIPNKSIAFVGDSLFYRGVGRCDLPGGSFEELEKSIKSKIFTLPDETIIYSGHGPSTILHEEKILNPFIKI